MALPLHQNYAYGFGFAFAFNVKSFSLNFYFRAHCTLYTLCAYRYLFSHCQVQKFQYILKINHTVTSFHYPAVYLSVGKSLQNERTRIKKKTNTKHKNNDITHVDFLVGTLKIVIRSRTSSSSVSSVKHKSFAICCLYQFCCSNFIFLFSLSFCYLFIFVAQRFGLKQQNNFTACNVMTSICVHSLFVCHSF